MNALFVKTSHKPIRTFALNIQPLKFMNRTMTTTLVIIGGAVLVAAAMIVKQHFSPAVKEAYFEPDTDKLRLVPSGIVAVRPTRFPLSYGKVRHYHGADDSLARTVGRNASLRQIMAEAYDCNETRVVLPADAPPDRFDFLVTVPQTRKHLRAAIQKNLGYAAHRETRDVDVLKLTVDDPALPGFTNSPDGEGAGVSYKAGRLYFQHQPLTVLLQGLQDGLASPVLDATGRTNCYDFSIVWNEAIHKKMEKGGFDLGRVQKFFHAFGLGLEPDTTNMEVYVVARAR